MIHELEHTADYASADMSIMQDMTEIPRPPILHRDTMLH